MELVAIRSSWAPYYSGLSGLLLVGRLVSVFIVSFAIPALAELILSYAVQRNYLLKSQPKLVHYMKNMFPNPTTQGPSAVERGSYRQVW